MYQHLLTYWLQTMKDDVYMISEDGWKAVVTEVVRKKGDRKVEGTVKVKKKEFICELIPKELLIQRYFGDEQAAIEKLEAEKEAKTAELEDLQEEHSGEDGLLAEVINDKGNITKGDLNKRVKELKKAKSADDADELAVLEQYAALDAAEGKAKKAIDKAEAELEVKLLEKYGELDEDDVKSLVVDDKWMGCVSRQVESELSDVSQSLSGTLIDLSRLYSTPCSELEAQSELLAEKVTTHLVAMGFECS